MKEYDTVVHKSVGRFSDLPSIREHALGNHKIACNSKVYYLDTDPACVSRFWKYVTCGNCKKKRKT